MGAFQSGMSKFFINFNRPLMERITTMSTRCQIGFYSDAEKDLYRPDVVIYRHSDGYPNGEHGVMVALVEWAKTFNKERGLSDSEYAAARALQTLMNTTAPTGTTGYGIDGDKKLHGDIEFYYRVDASGISVYKVRDDAKSVSWHTLGLVYKTEL